MTNHILNQCSKCPLEIKQKYGNEIQSSSKSSTSEEKESNKDILLEALEDTSLPSTSKKDTSSMSSSSESPLPSVKRKKASCQQTLSGYIKDTILDIPQQVDLTSSLIESLLKHVEERYEFCSKPIQFAANLLDARFKGEQLNKDQIMEAIDFISEMARSRNLDVGKVVDKIQKLVAIHSNLVINEKQIFIYDARPAPLLEDTCKDYAVLSVHEDEAEIESESDAWSEDSNSDSDENIPLSALVK
ncbi:unnamed protein product [Acanthoscelides obtectus]|uniref:Uncharacterized protein n=1 Tax=Acanthoscelides obtectus TaxID=200917 RepID=A0A9P0LJT1_ACAOB|nr:unnamed protein product [Acanthoscelides obtectus]CAK1620809.1 hypothetical protein AOBTE_LOCUS580 [Acanthoscelides obtectus]